MRYLDTTRFTAERDGGEVTDSELNTSHLVTRRF
jgi:hypothetical protein